MLLHLIAIVFAGLGAAGIALLLRKLSGSRLPKWIIPVFAGLGMLSFQIHHEYSWFDHKQGLLPEGSKVISSEKGTAFWRPWTFAFPMTTAFVVLDENTLDYQIIQGEKTARFMLYRFEKHYTDLVSHQAYLLNCDHRELVEIATSAEQPRRMQTLASEDPLYRTICTHR